MALSEAEKKRIRENWVKRQQYASDKMEQMKKEALFRAEKIAQYLKKTYGISNVILYGSLARNQWFDMHSDIDLFIEGLFEERSYFKILNEVEEIARPYKVSIVTDKEAADSLKNTILKEGRELQ